MTAVVDRLRVFFEAERARSPWRGVAVVVAIGLLPLVANLLAALKVPQADQPMVAFATRSATIEAPAMTVASLVLSLFWSVAFWLVYTAIAHGVTVLFDGEGAFAPLANLFGWCFLPAFALQVAWFVPVAVRIVTTPPPTPDEAHAWFEAVNSGPVVDALAWAYPLVLLVTLGMWLVATAVGRRVSYRQAALALVPVLAIEAALYYYQWVVLG